MELSSIEHLELYINEETEDKDGEIEIKRVPLNRDLKIGEAAYFRNSYRNKIVKHGENNYMFYRFDEIQTHIEGYDSGYSIEDISKKISSNLDYDIEYADDRVKLVEQLFEKNDWVYDLLSFNRIIQKEQKTKTDFSAEEQRLDRSIDYISDYILNPKFNNKESEGCYEEIKEKRNNLKKKTGKTEQEVKEMFDLRDEMDLINLGIISKSREKRNELREKSEVELKEMESDRIIIDPAEFTTEKSKIEYVGKDLVIDEGYWGRMGFTKEGTQFREEVMRGYEEALEILTNQLGHGEKQSVKNKIEKEAIKKLEKIEYVDSSGRKREIAPERRLVLLKKMYSELKSDYYRVKEILATPIHFTTIMSGKPKYNFSEDTWYESSNGEIVDVSKNMVLFSDINTYKGLITNYYNLKDKYYDNFQDDMWYMLLTFEDLIRQTKLSKEEKLVLDRIMRDYSRKEVVEEYEKEFEKEIRMYTLSNWINKVIPNKLLNTYLYSINEWVYTYKLKGEFKKCSKCGEVKTINNDRFFGKHSASLDGYRHYCKTCRSKK